jgi:hypothetical protein
MSDIIKTITDKKLFEKIFYKFFMDNPVFIRTKSGNLRITFFGYTDGLVAFRINYLKKIYEDSLVFTRNKDHLIYLHLKFTESQDENIYLFFPIKIQIISSARRENRKVLGMEGGGKKVVYVSNIISDFIIENTLAMALKQIDRIKEIIKFDLERHFEHIRIYLINEGMSDVRMKYFMENKTPLFISNLNEQPSEKKRKMFNFFVNEIYSKDYYLQNRKNLISEISIPVLYKAKIPYGYTQVNNSTPFSESIFATLKRVAMRIDELFNKHKVFSLSEERLLVSDISKSGLGVVFKERKFIRFFKEGCLVYFDLILPDNKKASILAVVRHIALLENKIIKVGCEIKDIDALSEVNFDEFLELVGASTV